MTTPLRTPVVAVPSLDAIAHNPAVATPLPAETRAVLLAQALAVVGALAAPALSTNGDGRATRGAGPRRSRSRAAAERRHGLRLPPPS